MGLRGGGHRLRASELKEAKTMFHPKVQRAMCALVLGGAMGCGSFPVHAGTVKTVFVIAMENHNWTQPSSPAGYGITRGRASFACLRAKGGKNDVSSKSSTGDVRVGSRRSNGVWKFPRPCGHCENGVRDRDGEPQLDAAQQSCGLWDYAGAGIVCVPPS